MNATRVRALVLKNLLYWTRSLNRLSDTFWWPVISLLVWGFFTYYVKATLPLAVSLFLGGLVFWFALQRAQQEISILFMDEIWGENLLNLFTTPVKFSEYLAGLILTSFLKLVMSLSVMAVFALILYHFNVFSLGFYFLPGVAVLAVFGWTLGILINSAILRFGRDSESLAWTLVFAVQPFSAVFYPLSTLPEAARYIAYLLPPTYIFEGMRSIIFGGSSPPFYLWMAIFLDAVYLLLALLAFRHTFFKAKETGFLARLVE